jgi:hypothetical protein
VTVASVLGQRVRSRDRALPVFVFVDRHHPDHCIDAWHLFQPIAAAMKTVKKIIFIAALFTVVVLSLRVTDARALDESMEKNEATTSSRVSRVAHRPSRRNEWR